jgi:hypothetical protein
MLSVVMLNVIMLNVIMLNVIMLNVVMLNVIVLSVIMLNVITLNVITLNVVMLNVAAPRWLDTRLDQVLTPLYGATPTNIRPGQKTFEATNSLAYSAAAAVEW